ncbi:hypothetical protein [Acinetobacter sp. WCHA45]|uniref:hypothetical protein n=1 Tax=Acinetobacter sp. WCHA45 TaxID=2004644 RepID=UPI000B3CF0CA|nr:hypothetical protein [Acinetobacter sp. WCHA45]AVZ85161.1 hypothetical protein CDG55_04930 [Acinetobacter sp. WCHA45]
MKLECKISTVDGEENIEIDLLDFIKYTNLSISAFLLYGWFINLNALNDYLSKGYVNDVGDIGVLSWTPIKVISTDYQQLINEIELIYGKKIIKHPELENCQSYKDWWRMQIRLANMERKKKTI